MQLSANSAWFTVTLNGRTDFQVYSFSGQEAVSQPYVFSLELVHPRHDEPLTAFIGAPVLLTIFDRSGTPRLVHGLVHEMSRLHRGNHLTHYQCRIVPRFWFLDKNREHRIFQNKSVQQIITQVLQEQGFASETFAFKCFNTYPPREYCVQYGESDLHFISRLCEEEGIYYYFEHSIDGHCLCFSDMPGGAPIPGLSVLRYAPGSGQVADTSVVSRVSLHAQALSDKAMYRDWSFLTPTVMLEASADEPDFAKAPAAPGIDYTTYRSPHLYQSIAEGERYARLQLLRQLTRQTWIEAQSDASRFMPGFTFSLHGHNNPQMNATWWITSVVHNGVQPQVLGREAPDSGMSYVAHLECIPESTQFVPELMHPKCRIIGDQTALITGPAGEEIYTDEYGRVKVQFFWDREGKQDENTTCWIRVSQGWAGTQYGTMALPRIGHEVIVSFLEGDPDRPLITGRVYHADNMPPYNLPLNKTRTVFKSMSTPGGDGGRGFNELRIEDKAGQEEIYIHAEKDVNVHVKNDWKVDIARDQRCTTDNNTYVRTEGETHETLRKQRKTELFATDNQTLHADSHTKVDDKWLTKVNAEVHLYAGEKAVFAAGTEATLKGGGSWIKLDPAGVFMGGSAISLGGGGSAGERKAAEPELPGAATSTEIASRATVNIAQLAVNHVQGIEPLESATSQGSTGDPCAYLTSLPANMNPPQDVMQRLHKQVSIVGARLEKVNFPSSNLEEEALVTTVNVQGHNIDVYFKSDNVLYEEQFRKIISSFEVMNKVMAESTHSVYISPSSNEYNMIYQKKNNNPDIFVLADALNGKINMYPELFTHNQHIIDSYVLHEFAHNVSSNLKNKNIGFIDVDWGIAMREDEVHISKYAQTSKSKDEDFSDSVVAYVASKNTLCEAVFRQKFPNRYKILENIFYAHNPNNPQN